MPRSFFAKGTQFMRVHKVVFECGLEKNGVYCCDAPPLPPAIIIYRGDESPREKSEKKKIGITDAEGSGSSF